MGRWAGAMIGGVALVGALGYSASAQWFTPQISGSGGTGLGLAIVRSIAEWHGGSVEIQSRTGGGTEVTLNLPRS